MTYPAVGDRVRVVDSHEHHAGVVGTVVGYGFRVCVVEADPAYAHPHPVLLIAPHLLEDAR